MFSLVDYDLVKKFKEEGLKECSVILFKRYIPLIRKYSGKVHKRDIDKRKDFEQDSYIELVKCLDGIVLKKIPTEIKDTWKFACRFEFYLRNLCKKYFISHKKNYYCNYDEIENVGKLNNYDDILNNKLVLENIYKIVNNTPLFSLKEKDIFFKRLQGHTLQSIEKKYNIAAAEYFFNKVLNYVVNKLKFIYGDKLTEVINE